MTASGSVHRSTPVSPAQTASASAPSVMNAHLSGALDGALPLRCFIVEDSPVIRQSLVATLEEMLAAKVVGTADDEGGALAWLDQVASPCDLMIIDIFLKSGTGLEVLRQARTRRPRSRLVVLTNYATTDMRRRCAELGADRVFDKSAELDELLAYCAGLSPVPDAS